MIIVGQQDTINGYDLLLTGDKWIKFARLDNTFLLPVLKNAKATASALIFHDIENVAFIDEIFRLAGWRKKDKLFWCTGFTYNQPRMRYQQKVYVISWYARGRVWTFTPSKPLLPFLQFKSSPGFKRNIPHEQSLDLLRTLIKNHSNIGELVFDPFADKCIVELAAHAEGRKSVCCVETSRQKIKVEESLRRWC